MRKVALVVVGTGEILDVVWKLSQQDLLMIESGMDVSDIRDFGLRNGEKWIAIDWDGENSGKGVSSSVWDSNPKPTPPPWMSLWVMLPIIYPISYISYRPCVNPPTCFLVCTQDFRNPSPFLSAFAHAVSCLGVLSPLCSLEHLLP